MALVWRQPSLDRCHGFDDDGEHVGHVGLVIADGGERTYWFAWRRDGSPQGVVVGRFASAEQAMAAVDET